MAALDTFVLAHEINHEMPIDHLITPMAIVGGLIIAAIIVLAIVVAAQSKRLHDLTAMIENQSIDRAKERLDARANEPQKVANP